MNDIAHLSKHHDVKMKTFVGIDNSRKLDKRLTVLLARDSSQAEAIRSLRSELLMRYFNNASQRNLALVSSDDSENLAVTTANLGIAFSQLGLKTLVIDANLRSPQLCKLFNFAEQSLGLTDLLANRTQPKPLSIKDIPSLSVMPAGIQVKNPQELLASKNFTHCIEQLSDDYDITLINTSASNTTRDAHLIATQSGACLVVAKQDASRVKDMKNLCVSFKALGVRILGVALWQ